MREAAGVSQAVVAKMASLRRPNSVSNWETGVTDAISSGLLMAYLQLAQSNDVSWAWLLGLDDDPAPKPARASRDFVLTAIRDRLGEVIMRAVEPVLVDIGVIAPSHLPPGAISPGDWGGRKQ
ncbi:MAG TPA: hypothetical protein VMW52_12590 [Phycisphaerae bacterium]|nr:hypothetical protein [Phycisphaerae bacterium]